MHADGVTGSAAKHHQSAALHLCRPSKVIFADEISTGLDSSTTFQIVQSFSNLAHMRKVLDNMLDAPPHGNV